MTSVSAATFSWLSGEMNQHILEGFSGYIPFGFLGLVNESSRNKKLGVLVIIGDHFIMLELSIYIPEGAWSTWGNFNNYCIILVDETTHPPFKFNLWVLLASKKTVGKNLL